MSTTAVEVALLVATTGCYSAAVAACWRAAGPGRIVREWQSVAFLVGVGAVILATTGPADEIADRSVAGHMGQHLALMFVAGPLLALGRPVEAVAAGLGRGLTPLRRSSRRLARAVSSAGWARLAASAIVAHTVVMVGWHVPRLYEAAAEDPWVHGLEHASMTAAAGAVWWVALGAGRRRPAAGSMVALFAAAFPMTILGFAMTMSRTRWYPVYGTGLEDQQAAGALLWGIGGVLAVVEATVLFACWFATEDPVVSPRARSGWSSVVGDPTGTRRAR